MGRIMSGAEEFTDCDWPALLAFTEQSRAALRRVHAGSRFLLAERRASSDTPWASYDVYCWQTFTGKEQGELPGESVTVTHDEEDMPRDVWPVLAQAARRLRVRLVALCDDVPTEAGVQYLAAPCDPAHDDRLFIADDYPGGWHVWEAPPVSGPEWRENRAPRQQSPGPQCPNVQCMR